MLSRWIPTIALGAVGLALAVLWPVDAASQPREPVYVGVRVCSECHAGAVAGHQFSIWRQSAHAKAFATLAMPESLEIARISGIPEAPHTARVCLGCHATAADTEEWERDESFRIEDGVQCEGCHGPGSEYMDEAVMSDPRLARERGLRVPEAGDCMICHAPKGSHEAVLPARPYEVEAALESIAHPKPSTPGAWSNREETEPLLRASDHRFVGVAGCAGCHSGPEMGFQFSRWRMGPHARAYAVLATPAAYEMARRSGVAGDPQTSYACLRCHATGAGFESGSFADGFDLRDGVQCESCHGAGEDYSPEAVMLDPAAARASGLRQPSAAVCLSCHQQGHAGAPFDYQAAVARIAHPTRPAATAAAEPRYKTPVNLALTPDGRELWVACEASSSAIVIDTTTGTKVA